MTLSNPDYLLYRATSGGMYLIKRKNLLTRKLLSRGFFVSQFKARHRQRRKV